MIGRIKMEIGKKIKALRIEKGITQETLAAALNISSQAISKWETNAAEPDIQMLPALSIYFGVTIDELFSLTDESMMERIENVILNQHQIPASDYEWARDFLLNKRYEKGISPQILTKVLVLLADLENHMATDAQARARAYAKEALTLAPDCKAAHVALCKAAQGYIPDWCVRNHHELINYYKDFVAKNPNYDKGYLWLLDNLIADHRFVEAESYLEKMASVDASYHTPLYRGLIKWSKGEKEAAQTIWSQMLHDFSNEWTAYFAMGDVMVQENDYDKAISYYRQAFNTQPLPRYTDSLASIAHIYEICEKTEEAIQTYEEMLILLKGEWQMTSGEVVDDIKRTMTRLQHNLK